MVDEKQVVSMPEPGASAAEGGQPAARVIVQ